MGKKSRQKQQTKSPNKSQPKVSQPKASQGLVIPSLAGEAAAMPQASASMNTPAKPGQLMEQGDLIKGDIIRICLLLGIVAIVLIILVLVNDKTALLHNAGKHLATFLRLG